MVTDYWVIIAAYYEEKHISDVVRRVKKQGFKNIVVVDDGSKDKTTSLAQKEKVIVLRHMVNLGKGAAMKTGAEYALLNGAKGVIFLDGDGQHKPEELPLFVKELRKGYDIVFGYRKLNEHMPFVMRFGNWFISTIVRVLYRMDLHDVTSGYRALSARAYEQIRWTSRDYRVEVEMIARAGKQHLNYSQFEIATIYHDKYKGTTFLDGFPIVGNLLWWRISL
jgi:UDP-N-acetylglucosamine---dolichyl-phosphate N-acetylglucosaminyltransferase